MLLKFGTVEEIKRFKNDMPEAVYQEAHKVVERLDDAYGADRDVTEDDGGFCLVAVTVQDVAFINKAYINTESGRHEWAEVIKIKGGGKCVHALFLTNNEFGINVFFLNYGITPRIILDEIEGINNNEEIISDKK